MKKIFKKIWATQGFDATQCSFEQGYGIVPRQERKWR